MNLITLATVKPGDLFFANFAEGEADPEPGYYLAHTITQDMNLFTVATVKIGYINDWRLFEFPPDQAPQVELVTGPMNQELTEETEYWRARFTKEAAVKHEG